MWVKNQQNKTKPELKLTGQLWCFYNRPAGDSCGPWGLPGAPWRRVGDSWCRLLLTSSSSLIHISPSGSDRLFLQKLRAGHHVYEVHNTSSTQHNKYTTRPQHLFLWCFCVLREFHTKEDCPCGFGSDEATAWEPSFITVLGQLLFCGLEFSSIRREK